MTPGTDDPIDRDAWLQQALRHAPDADAAPPAAVSEAILARARQAGAAPGTARLSGWPGTVLAWIARPPVAAGFATLAVSTVLGTLWWGGSLDDGADPRPQASRPAREVTGPSPESASRMPPAAPLAARPEAAEPEPGPREAQPAAAEPARQSAAGAAARQPAARQKAAERAAEALQPSAPSEPRRESPSSPAGPTADPADRVELHRPAPPSPDEAAGRDPAAAPSLSAAASGASLPAEQRARREAGRPLARDATAPRAAGPQPADPLQPIVRELAERGTGLRWRWAGRPHAHDAIRQAWFDTLHATTRGRWRPVAPAPGAAGASMQLFAGPRVRAEWRIADDRVLLMDPTLGMWQAPLEPAEATRLRNLADRW